MVTWPAFPPGAVLGPTCCMASPQRSSTAACDMYRHSWLRSRCCSRGGGTCPPHSGCLCAARGRSQQRGRTGLRQGSRDRAKNSGPAHRSGSQGLGRASRNGGKRHQDNGGEGKRETQDTVSTLHSAVGLKTAREPGPHKPTLLLSLRLHVPGVQLAEHDKALGYRGGGGGGCFENHWNRQTQNFSRHTHIFYWSVRAGIKSLLLTMENSTCIGIDVCKNG